MKGLGLLDKEQTKEYIDSLDKISDNMIGDIKRYRDVEIEKSNVAFDEVAEVYAKLKEIVEPELAKEIDPKSGRSFINFDKLMSKGSAYGVDCIIFYLKRCVKALAKSEEEVSEDVAEAKQEEVQDDQPNKTEIEPLTEQQIEENNKEEIRQLFANTECSFGKMRILGHRQDLSALFKSKLNTVETIIEEPGQ